MKRQLITLVLLLSFFCSGIGVGQVYASSPSVDGQGMNMNSFGSVTGGTVDLASGAFTTTKEDIRLPGPNGFDLVVNRRYNSKEFLASPKWSSMEGDAFLNYAGKDLSKIEWQAATPAQFGGWIGNGWKSNISGRMVYVHFYTQHKETKWWGATPINEETRKTEIVIIQLPEGSYSFKKKYHKKDRDVKTNEEAYIAQDSGSHARLLPTKDGLSLQLIGGRKYYFAKQFYKKTFEIDFRMDTNFQSESVNDKSDNFVFGYYMTRVEDRFGNWVEYDYDELPTYVYDQKKEKILTNPFLTTGVNLASGKDAFNVKSNIAALNEAVTASALKKAQQKLREAGDTTILDANETTIVNNKYSVDPKKMGKAAAMEVVLSLLMSDKSLEEILLDVLVSQGKSFAIKQAVLLMATLMPALGPLYAIYEAVKAVLTVLVPDIIEGKFRSNLSITPMRPIKIRHSLGYQVNIEYLEPLVVPVKRYEYTTVTKIVEEETVKFVIEHDFEGESNDTSRLKRLTYRGPTLDNPLKTEEKEIKYFYDDNGLLSYVEKPGYTDKKTREIYSYMYHYAPDSNGKLPADFESINDKKSNAEYINYDDSTGFDYKTNGYLLTGITYPTGVEMNMTYEFIHVKDRYQNATDDEDTRLSSYVLLDRKLSDDANGGTAQSWIYDGYDNVSLYSPYSMDDDSDEEPQRSLQFDVLTINDPRDKSHRHEFRGGLPLKVMDPENKSQVFVWNYQKRNLIRHREFRGGFEYKTQYNGYDDYGLFSEKVVSGKRGVTKTFVYEYERSEPYIENNIVDKVTRTWLDADGKRYNDTTNQYDGLGKGMLVSQIIENGDGTQERWAYNHDNYGNVVKRTNDRGLIEEWNYDSNGVHWLSKSINSINNRELASITSRKFYENSALVSSETNEANIQNTYTYDDRGRLIDNDKISGSDTIKTHMEYTDSPGGLEAIMDITYSDRNFNKRVEAEFNGYGKATSIVVKPKDGSGDETTTYAYDSLHNITGVTSFGDRTTTYEYDDLNRVKTITKKGEESKLFSYLDGSGQVVHRDEKGNKIYYGRDVHGNIDRVRLADGRQAQYTYNGLDQLIKVKDLRGLKTLRTYNNRGWMTSETDPKGNRSVFLYDNYGFIQTKKDARNKLTTFSDYDSRGRIGKITFSDGRSESYNYDTAFMGQVTSIERSGLGSNPAEQIEYTYDNWGNLNKENVGIGDYSYQLSYDYSDSGLMETLKVNQAHNQYYSYDGRGRLTAIDVKGSESKLSVFDNAEYNNYGMLNSYKYGDHHATLLYEDNVNRLIKKHITEEPTSQTSFDLVELGYSYDDVGNVVEKTTRLNDSQVDLTEQYNYNKRDELTERKISLGSGEKETHRYGTDGYGNISSYTHGRGKERFQMDTQSDRLLEQTPYLKKDQGTRYEYDENGNRTKAIDFKDDNTKSETEYIWSEDNRLTDVKVDGKLIQKNYYRGNGLRYKKDVFGITDTQDTLEPQQLRLHTYIYDSQQRLINETITYYVDVKKGEKLVRQTGEVDTRNYVYRDGIGQDRLAIVSSSTAPIESRDVDPGEAQTTWVHTDAMGSVVGLTLPLLTTENIKGKVYTRSGKNVYVTSPWGHREYVRSNLFYDETEVYTGKMFEDEIGLYYFNHRYYDPTSMRFLSKDPAGMVVSDPRTINRYTFVNNNPLRYYDPDGRFWKELGLFTLDVAKESAKYALIGGAINVTAQLAMGNDNVGQTFLDGAKGGAIYGGIYGVHMHRNRWNKVPKKQPKDKSSTYVVDEHNDYHDGMAKFLSDTFTVKIPYWKNKSFEFILFGGHSEGIYDGNENLYIGQDFGGTYNYWRFGPAHFVFDMLPYYIWDNGQIFYE
jgi:RHS repeat-associated protein